MIIMLNYVLAMMDMMYLFIQAWLEYEKVASLLFSNCCILKFAFDNGKFEFIEAINHTF